MKKTYFLFLFALIASLMGGANAAEQTYSYTFTEKTWGAAGAVELNGINWNLATDAGHFGWDNNKGVQIGSKGNPAKTATLSTSEISGTIKSISLETSGAKGISCKLNVTVGDAAFGDEISLTTANTKYDFKGSASGEIAFSYANTAKAAIYIKSITVVYETAAPTEVAAPVISGVENGVSYTGSATVKISYPELATGITYSITKEGETEAPKTATAAVEETVTEAGTYTVKASATDGTATKEAETVTFTVIEQPKAASISEFITLGGQFAKGTAIELTCPLTVNYQNGNRLFVKDAEGSVLLIYGTIEQTYANGDVIPAGVKGTYDDSYNNTPQLENPENFTAATEKAEANSTEMAVKDITTADVNKYILIKGVTVDATAGKFTDVDGNNIAFYDTFKLNNTPEDGNTYNVTAIVSIYKNAVQVAPIKYEVAQITTVAAPVFSLEEGTYNATQTLSITCPTEGATISYMVEGGAEEIIDESTSPVSIELLAVDGVATTYTVTAQASLGELHSAEVVKTYIIDPNASAEQTATIDMKEVATENGWIDGNTSNTAYLTFEKFGFGFEVTEGTANSGKYYNNANSETSYSWRMYNGTNLTITAPANTTISNIEFVKDSKWQLTMTADNGVADSKNMTWNSETGTPAVTFTFTGSGRCDIKQINITYVTKTSGVEAVETGNEVITAEGGNIVVKADAAVANIYTAAGQLVRSANVEGEATIAVPAGFYVVKAGNTVAKVIVR